MLAQNLRIDRRDSWASGSPSSQTISANIFRNVAAHEIVNGLSPIYCDRVTTSSERDVRLQ